MSHTSIPHGDKGTLLLSPNVQYGNGHQTQYYYDNLGRISETRKLSGNTVDIFKYSYDNNGNLICLNDGSAGNITYFGYDSIGRFVNAINNNGFSIYQNYDAFNRINKINYSRGGVSQTYWYNYNEKNLIGSVNLPTGKILTNNYDGLNRLISTSVNTASPIVSQYSYKNGLNGTTSGLVSSVTTPQGVYSYNYDANGNITSIAKNGTVLESYTYDSLNQLKTVTRGSDTYEYTYDTCGNIQNVKLNGSVVKTYGYSDENWRDKLTSYNGQTITYDGIGNPLTYRDGMSFTWENGRSLESFNNSSYNILYKYNADGIRVEKHITNKITETTESHYYDYNGTQLVCERWGDNIVWYLYDESGNPIGFTYNGTEYYYLKNVQGDITGIANANGTVVVEYSYDVWGKLLSVTGSLADTIGQINSLRYRGYYYDTETGLYLTGTRYYDPEIGRFINADGVISGTGESVQGYNLFAYCFNNPVNMSDPTGNWPRWATIALGAVAAVAAVAVTVVTLGAAAPAAACTLTAVGMSIGASYAVASTAATVAVVATTVAAAAYAGDIAYSAVTGDSLLLDTVFQGNTDAYNTGLAITSIATAGMLEAAAQSPGVCFVAGTPVLAACGYIAIEEIKAGDMVWAENPETGEKELKEVVQTFVNETTELIYIQVGSEEIVTTPEHPFYSPIKGWIAACKLRTGDILVLQNGKYVTVEKVQHEILEAPITVYNFEVADFHTYYVGKNAVLVHNTCGRNSSSRGVGGKGWVGDKTWRENVSTVGNGGTITSLNGGIPTKAQAMQLINQSGGTPLRIEGAHQFPNPHNYTHINYVTSSGVKGTIKIFE